MSDDSGPIGPMLDALGVTASLDDNQQITEAVIIAKISDFATGRAMLGLYTSEGLDWIAQYGLVAAASHVLNDAEAVDPDGDDE